MRKREERVSPLETEYLRWLTPPPGPTPDVLQQPTQLKVVESRTVYAIHEPLQEQAQKK